MASFNILVLDLETQKLFSEVGRSRLERLKISVVGIYDYVTDQYLAYEEKDIVNLEKRLRDADLIVGFNIERFDLPVLEPYLFVPVKNLPVLDLLKDIEKTRGHRAGLNHIARPTLKQQKSGQGRDAIALFKENRMEELKRYCLDDVRLTKEIYDFGCREGKVYFTSDRDYKTYEIPVFWKQATEEFIRRKGSVTQNFPVSLF
ncbi:MAG: ribonuclease H-like domain-containing protein [Candidatus Omnitrophica bacterium]|nr:ribonuclease H-like domain-containing protein [Candidatus Omnitrophota bacterium]